MNEPNDASIKMYTFIGRVHPEHLNYSMYQLPKLSYNSDDGFTTTYRFQLYSSQMSIIVETNHEVKLFDLKNAVNSMAGAALDSLGYILSSALSLEIIGCIDPSGEWCVFDTVFGGFREQGEGAEQREFETLNLLLPHALSAAAVRLALADLRRAIGEPSDTVFHCDRAVESIRQEYTVQADGKKRDESWNRLRQALSMSREELDWLKSPAERRRHGESVDVSNEIRQRAIKIAREVIYKHCAARSLDSHVKVEVI
jgi:hypothetical protein